MKVCASGVLLFASLLVASCQQKANNSVVFEQGPASSYCSPMTSDQGDEILSRFKSYIFKNEQIASNESGEIWRIQGPLLCGDNISFFGKKDLRTEGGKINLEVGAHFTARYDTVREEFVIVGGM